MNDDHWNERLEAFREEYNAPPETPRDEIWDSIEAALEQAPPEEVLTTMRKVYRRPPEAPRDEMWVAIEAELPAGREATDIIAIGPARRRQTQRELVWTRQRTSLATAAALLILGIGLGRLSVSPSGTPVEPAEVASTEAASAEVASAELAAGTMRVAAADHFSRTESLLMMVSSDARAGRVDAEVGQWARTLLLETRLLIDSSVALDPMILVLLEDVEVILMQVARLSLQFDGSRGGELDLITEGIENNDVMLRIRAALAAGPVQAEI